MPDRLWIAGGIIAALIFITGHAFPNDLYPNCRGWINHTCCCTQGACNEVHPGELEQISEDTYRVVITGEIATRTDWSKDGTFIRCAATFDTETGHWHIGPQFKTRCLYVPQPSS